MKIKTELWRAIEKCRKKIHLTFVFIKRKKVFPVFYFPLIFVEMIILYNFFYEFKSPKYSRRFEACFTGLLLFLFENEPGLNRKAFELCERI